MPNTSGIACFALPATSWLYSGTTIAMSSFMPWLTACLSEFAPSSPYSTRNSASASELWASERYEEKSEVPSGVAVAPTSVQPASSKNCFIDDRTLSPQL